MASRPAWCAQTKKTGTSGQVLMCQRALVKTDHADAAGTLNAVTLTITALGSSRAALMMASRTRKYVVPSSTPAAVSTATSAGASAVIDRTPGSLVALGPFTFAVFFCKGVRPTLSEDPR